MARAIQTVTDAKGGSEGTAERGIWKTRRIYGIESSSDRP
jgi:hypothetical protein